MPAEFDHHARDYDEQLGPALKITGQTRHHFLQRRVAWLGFRLRQYRMQPGEILDFGCGIGDALPVLQAELKPHRLTGFDISETSLKMAAERWPDQPFEFTERLEDQDRFSLAYVNGVLHHVPKAERPDALAQLYKALQPDGVLAFFENNPLNPVMVHAMKKVPFDHNAVTLTPWESTALLRRAGFKILQLDFLFFFPAFLKWLIPLESYLCKLPLGAQYLVLARKETH
jgi:SAM-dependent methyltransferase